MRMPAEGRVRTLDPAALAWIAAVPCAVLTALLVALLGPPLGNTFLGPPSGLQGEPAELVDRSAGRG